MTGLQGVDDDGDPVPAGHAPVPDGAGDDADEVVPRLGGAPVEQIAHELPPLHEGAVEVAGDVGSGERPGEEPGELHRPAGEAV